MPDESRPAGIGWNRGLKIDFDMVLLVLASGIYRILAKTMRGYSDAQARQILRDLIDVPADVTITDREVQVSVHRRSHLPILLSSGLFDQPVAVPWRNGLKLVLGRICSVEIQAGVVLLRGEPLVPEARAFALLSALRDCEAELNQAAIISLDWSDKPRARVLPLR